MKTTSKLIIIGFILAIYYEALGQAQYLTLRQPDGTTFQAIERGDEWLHFFETPEGYIVQRGPNGFFQYSTIDAAGEFISMGLRAGIDVPRNVPIRPYNLPAVQQALKQKINSYNAGAEVNRQRYLQRQRNVLSKSSGTNKGSTTQSIQQEVTLQVGVLLVEFTGRPHYTGGTRPNGYTVTDFELMLFSNNQYISPTVFSPESEQVFGSLRDYFEFQSHGLLHVTGQVINPNTNGIPIWLNMGSSTPYNTLGESYDLLEDAINQAIAAGWNCNYDIVAILVSQDDWTWYTTGVAWFQSHYSANQFSPSFDFANWFGGYVFNERNSAEYRDSNQATFSHIGINAHEMFHVIGWGMFSILGEGGLIWAHSGSGDWSSMNVGYRTGPLRKTESPGDLDPVARAVMEWATPTQINTDLPNEPVQYLEMDNNPTGNFDFYQFNDPASGSTQQFIVENRQYSGLNSYLPEWWKAGSKGGLLVWWRDGQSRDLRRADNNSNVVLEGMPHVSDGDLGDPYPGSTNNQTISMATTPNTNNISGEPTGFAVINIPTSAATMTVNFRRSYLASNSADATGFNNSRKLVRDAGGAYHLVFGTGGEIYYQKSTDGGSSWSAYKRLSASNGNNKFSCLTERSGKLYVVWQRKNGSTHDVYFATSQDGGTSWSNYVLASTSLSADPLPVIQACVTTNFSLMAIYRTNSGGSTRLVARRTTSANPALGNWSAETTVPSTGANDFSPTLAGTKNYWGEDGNFGVAFATTTGTIQYRYYQHATGGWSSTQFNLSSIVPGSNLTHKEPSITGEGTGLTNLHVAWHRVYGPGSSNYDHVLIHRKSNGFDY